MLIELCTGLLMLWRAEWMLLLLLASVIYCTQKTLAKATVFDVLMKKKTPLKRDYLSIKEGISICSETA